MSDSPVPDALDARHEQARQERIEAVKRWVEYITTEPPEIWGPQQNAIVNSQLAAAQHVETSAAHHQHVTAVAADIAEAGDDAADQPDG